MILFCDTSALVKLYIVEVGSDELKAQVQEAEAVVLHGQKPMQHCLGEREKCLKMLWS